MLKREILFYIQSLADLFLPRRCIVCGSSLGIREKYICMSCKSDIPYTYYWCRPHNPMADRFNEAIQRSLPESGLREPYAYSCALFFYRYSGGYREITRELKYRGNREEGRYFARELAGYLALQEHFADIDAVVPVPLHPSRFRERGYNQAEVIAREVSVCLKVPCLTQMLERVRKTATQTHLDAAEKERNVSSAFIFRKCAGKPIQHLLLVDDVFTTGATANACHKVLRTALGPRVRISVATLGCVDPDF